MASALSQGGVRKSLTCVEWDVSTGCESPVTIEIEGRLNPREKLSNWTAVPEHDSGPDYQRIVTDVAFRPVYRYRDTFPKEWPLVIILDTKCRQCRHCLMLRARHWRIRAESEILAAPRTWFGTLTLSPEEHFRVVAQADARLSRGGTDLARLPDRVQFSEVYTEIGRDVTKWLKRIRKESGARLRYALVAEKHKSGLPHMHVLVHETVGGGSVRERTLRKQWQLGHSKFNLVHDKGAARYVAKYLSKSSQARVRASIDYGNHDLSHRG